MRLGIEEGRTIKGSLAGVGGILFLTYCAFALHVNVPSAGFLYLLLIVLVALHAGFAAATAASLVAVICLDYYFVPPIFSVSITDPQNWLAIMTFECTALIVSRLSSRANEQARIAEKQHADRTKLYQLSRGVLLSDPSRPVNSQILTLVKQMLHVEDAVIFDAVEVTSHGIGNAADALEILARNTYLMDRDHDSPGKAEWSRVLRLGGKPVGSIALRSEGLNSDLADAVASLTAIAMERSRALDRAARAEASRHGEQLRSAVLDSLAHAFKTPLTTIRAASSGLLEMASLQGAEATLAGLIDQESERLTKLANQLLRTARLEKMRLKPAEECNLEEIIQGLLKELSWQLSGNVLSVKMPASLSPVRGDRDLITTGLMQLLDNAAKYSVPGSAITIAAESQPLTTVVSVHNWGPVIRPDERGKIFERFYRAPGSEHLAAGTGLGLSITRRAAEAHGGRAWVESSAETGTIFYFALPNRSGQEADKPPVLPELENVTQAYEM
jgi:two-component system sensor histidine kinase KdpD